MIHSYTVKNFYSIKDKVEVRFDANEHAPDSFAYKRDCDTKLSLVEAIIGPNASGKTNTVKALAFMRHLIAEMTDTDDDDDIPVSGFAGSNEPTELEAVFSVGDRLFSYSFVLNNERILSEELKERTKTEKRKTFKRVLFRKWENDAYTVDSIFPSATFTPRRNASLISQISRNQNLDDARLIIDYWRNYVVTNVWMYGNRDDHDRHYRVHGDRETEVAIRDLYRDYDLLVQAKDILQKLDVGFSDFHEIETGLENKPKKHQILHKHGVHEFVHDLAYESSGTKRSILQLSLILKALKNKGAIAALDEFDAYLHPEIVEYLVKLFLSPVTNPNGAQLLFSSHSHSLLAEFDKQQITLVEKNEKGATEVWRLDDVSGVRSDDNYYRKYVAGAYDAKPKLGI